MPDLHPVRSGAERVIGILTRRQVVLLGLAGVVLEVAVVHTALAGLRRVEVAYDGISKTTQAQRYFQDADMTHDALRADLLQAVLDGEHPEQAPPAMTRHGLQADAAEFRQQLRQVDAVALPPALAAMVRGVRDDQERYVRTALQIGERARTDPTGAAAQLPAFMVQFVHLEGAQATITSQLSATALTRAAEADRDERAVRLRITAAAAIALLGLLLLVLRLDRLGRALRDVVLHDRGVATILQHSLLPEALPELPGLQLAARYHAGGAGAEVGGDWYDVLALPGGTLGLVMGDVAGHDLRAATVMGQLRHALRAYALQGMPPGEVLERLNKLTMTQARDEMATCLYAVLDPVSGTMEVASAGHLPPMAVMPDGRVTALHQPASPPLGAVRDVQYPTARHDVPGGTRIVLFTDGLVESRGVSVDEGLLRLEELLRDPGEDLEAFCDRLLEECLGDGTAEDDIALLAVRSATLLGPELDLTWPADARSLVDLRRVLERWLGEAHADPQETYEIVVACSEAATNAIEHAYGPGAFTFEVHGRYALDEGLVTVEVRDSGHWRAPPRGRDRGRGRHLVEGLMDDVHMMTGEHGTTVRMERRLAGGVALVVAEGVDQVPA